MSENDKKNFQKKFLKMFAWTCTMQFDNPAENFSPKVQKDFTQIPKITIELYFSHKKILSSSCFPGLQQFCRKVQVK